MKKSLGPLTLLYPHPVLLVGTYDADGRPNLMNAAWGGICCSDPPCVAVSVRPSRHTFQAIRDRGAFTINIPSVDHVAQADFVGMASGRTHDKFAEAGLTAAQSPVVDAPYMEQAPLVLACRLLHTFELGMHTQFVGQILDCLCDEEALGEGGQPDIEKVRPFLYAGGNRAYYEVGRRLAPAFSVGRTLLRRTPESER